ncbi:MAG TPA: type II toxin-antitoxin system HipA family toxin [Pirellulales bacterium]|jgi:serine/threonine-protein kinase HipA|nr:type II toxin-antitoxin system HipA family toxin [Pirellulales bacterium]
MADRQILVYIDLKSGPFLVGRLWSRFRHERESATFEYDRAWLAHPECFALEPALMLDRGPQHTAHDQRLFGALGDSAPDRWGRALMRRAERRQAETERRPIRTLGEVDYLLLVDDEARQGALRFALRKDGPFLASTGVSRIPPFVELPRLVSAGQHVATETETDEELQMLLAPGSSLGGARPKALVRDLDGGLAIAKFPHPNDEYDVEKWEAVALALASRAGIVVPDWRIEAVSDKSVLLLRRFDREGTTRTPFLSAMSMLGARDNERHSYVEIVDALRRYGAQPVEDARSLWRRVVLNVLVSNTDDHLRNHGFLYTGGRGWRLAPAYDLNPVPIDLKPRVLSTSIAPDQDAASLELALEHAEYFGLDSRQANRIAGEVGKAVSLWRAEAKKRGLSPAAIDRMKTAFEHCDLEAALRHADS